MKCIIVDTNAYLRLYCSSVRPILGGEFGGRRLMIIQELYDEFHNSSQLTHTFHWMATPEARDEMSASVLKFRGENVRRIREKRPEVDAASRVLLAAYCKARGIALRSLSLCDRQVLATAAAMGYDVCTDEWPMAYVAEQVDCHVLSSLQILKAMEMDAKITADQRSNVVADWQRLNEALPKGWQTAYRTLFGDDPPVP